MDTSVPDFSVVVPVRNEADNISPLIAELKTVMTALQPYEIVIVDDGSDDDGRTTLKFCRTPIPSHPGIK